MLLCVLLLCAVALGTFGENAKYFRYFAIALGPTDKKNAEQREELKNMRGGAPNEIFLEMSKSGRSESVLFRRAAASICMSPWMLAAEPS